MRKVSAIRKQNQLVPRGRILKEAMALQPYIDAIQDSLDRFQVLYEEGGDIVSAFLDLEAQIGDLSDAVDKAEKAES